MASGTSAADGGHRPRRLEEPRVVDAVPGQLDGDRAPPYRGQLLVTGAGPHRVPEVAFLPREQAVADLAVGGEPDPVARPAERPGHRADHADPGRAAVDQEGFRGRRSTGGRVVRREGELR